MAKTTTHAGWTRALIAGLAVSGATCLASAQASRTVSGTASAQDRAATRLANPRVTEFSLEWSQIAHDLGRDIARSRFEQIMLDRRRPLSVRAREARDAKLSNPVRFDVPPAPMARRAGTGRTVNAGVNAYRTALPDAPASDTVSPAESMPGGLYVPQAWPIVETPQGPEIHVPYTFSNTIIFDFFFNPDILSDPETYNSSQALPNILAVQQILQIDLDELQIDTDGDGTPETVPLKFVGFNPTIHDRAIIWTSNSIDPTFVSEFFALGGDGAPGDACTNRINGFGAPTTFEIEGVFAALGTSDTTGQLDTEFDAPAAALAAERVIEQCQWSDVAAMTRSIGFALGLTWHQARDDRDTFIEVFPENLLPLEVPDANQLPPFLLFAPTNTTAAFVQFAAFGPNTDAIPDNVPDGYVTFGEYDAFSIMHQDAFALSVNGGQTFFPEAALLATAAVEIENQRRLDDNDPDTVPIPGSPLSTDPDTFTGRTELRDLMGFVPEFSTGDIATLTELYTTNPFFPGEDPRCPVDANRDGLTDFRDVIAFGELMASDSFAADLDGSGFINPTDLNTFYTAYQSGVCREDFDSDDDTGNGFVVPDGCEFNIDRELTGDQVIDFQDRQAFTDLLYGQNGVTQNLAMDLNFDGELNFFDAQIFNAGGAATDPFGNGTCVPGTTAPRTNGCPWDIDADGDQDFQDRLAFASLMAGGDLVADVDLDGLVDENDMFSLFGPGGTGDGVFEFSFGTCNDGEALPETNGCTVDIDDNGFQDWNDLRLFEVLIEANDPVADFNFDGRIDFEDRNTFVAAFVTGECREGNGLPFSDGCTFDLNVDGRQDWNDRILYGDLLLANDLIVDRFANNATGAGDGAIDFADAAAMNQVDGTGSFVLLGECLPQGALQPLGDGCPFDINVDGVQNFQDVEAFSDLFADGHPAADLNGDGFVDDLDLAVFNDDATGYTNGVCREGALEPEDDGCPQDINGDGIQSPLDLTLFIDLWNAGNIAADYDGDGILELDDLQEFLADFTPGFCSSEFPEPDPDNRPGTTQPIFEG